MKKTTHEEFVKRLNKTNSNNDILIITLPKSK